MDLVYEYCQECKGYTLTYPGGPCENPDCPNMPCCGKPRDECACEYKSGTKLPTVIDDRI